jgi:hypothetical protein
MGNDSKNPKILLDQIAQFMAREAEEMSDQELLDEAAETKGEAFARVDDLKRLLEERRSVARRTRLEQARANYEAALTLRKTRRVRTRPPIAQIRSHIAQLFSNGGGSSLGVAYRNAEYQSDEDVLSLWDQLYELGAIDEKGKPES